MKFLILSDCHSVPVNGLDLQHYEGVCVCGDITNFGTSEDVDKVFSLIQQANLPIFAVWGNCDPYSVQQHLETIHYSIHGCTKLFKSIYLFGVGYSLPCPNSTPGEVSEDELFRYLPSSLPADPTFSMWMIIHHPPFQTSCDRLKTGYHVGSRVFRQFIEHFQPTVVVCGHIHEARSIDKIGKSVIVNPGPWCQGYYGEILVEGKSIQVELKHISPK